MEPPKQKAPHRNPRKRNTKRRRKKDPYSSVFGRRFVGFVFDSRRNVSTDAARATRFRMFRRRVAERGGPFQTFKQKREPENEVRKREGERIIAWERGVSSPSHRSPPVSPPAASISAQSGNQE
jgi:hypothetical protein